MRHDKALHTVKHQDHLKNVPEYIVPETLKSMTGMKSNKRRKARKGGAGFQGKKTETQKKFIKRTGDPLFLGVAKKRK